MKKLFLGVAIGLLSLPMLRAQINMEAIEFGLRAGYAHTIVGGNIPDAYDVKGQSGFLIGLFTEIPVAEKFSVQPEIHYATQGAEAIGNGRNAEIKSQHINIPILLKYYVADGFNLQLGPQVSFHTGDDSAFSSDNAIEAELLSQYDTSEIYNNTLFGGTLGAGYKFDFGLTLDARYNLGFSEYLDKDNALVKLVNVDDLKNSVFSFSVGYAF